MLTTLINCEVTEGPRAGFKTVSVDSVEGWKEFFTIEERFLKSQNDTFLLPIRVVGIDREQRLKLIQLPVEADSGASRVWVSFDAIINPDEDEVPA
jgi:hypothetical protein